MDDLVDRLSGVEISRSMLVLHFELLTCLIGMKPLPQAPSTFAKTLHLQKDFLEKSLVLGRSNVSGKVALEQLLSFGNPIFAAYEYFRRFPLVVANGDERVCEERAHVVQPSYVENIQALVEAIAEFYPTEALRQQTVSLLLGAVLGVSLETVSLSPSQSSRKESRPDAAVLRRLIHTLQHSQAAKYHLTLVVEYKNEYGSAVAQAGAYFYENYYNVLEKPEAGQTIEGSIPGFSMTICGNELSISGVYCRYPTVYSRTLFSKKLECMGTDDVYTLCQELSALRKCLFYLSDNESCLQPRTDFPWIKSVPEVQYADQFPELVLSTLYSKDVSHIPHVDLVFLGRLDKSKDNVFLCESLHKKCQVVAKFTDRYGIIAHEQVASEGLAPQLFGCGTLAGKHVVVMEYLSPQQGYYSVSAPEVREFASVIASQLQDLKTMLRAKDICHGDIRAPNVMFNVNTKRIVLLDFDWASVRSEGCRPQLYPINIYHFVSGVVGLGEISHEIDEAMIDALAVDVQRSHYR